MIEAARRVEYDHYLNGRLIKADRFITTPDNVIRAILAQRVASSLSRPRLQQWMGLGPRMWLLSQRGHPRLSLRCDRDAGKLLRAAPINNVAQSGK